MITLLELNCTGMFRWGFMPTIQLDNLNTVFIRGINDDADGGSNGAGKSSIINAIKEIIFGRNDTGKSGPNVVNKHKKWKNGSFGYLMLKDRHENMWRILMLRKWEGDPPDPKILEHASDVLLSGAKYQGTDVFLERWNQTDNKWIDERATSIGNKVFSDTYHKIAEEVIGMTYEQFSAYVCLGQRAESVLVDGTSGEREKIIQSITDVSLWDRAALATKREADHKEYLLQLSESKLIGLKTAMSSFSMPSPDEIQAAEFEVVAAEDELAELMSKLSTAHNLILSKRKEFEVASQQCVGINDELCILEAEERHSIDRLNNQELPQPGILTENQNKASALQFKIGAEKALICKYTNLQRGACPTCGQNITDEHLAKELQKLGASIDVDTAALSEVNDQIKFMRDDHYASVSMAKDKARLKYEEEIHHLNEAREKLLEQAALPQQIERDITGFQTQASQITMSISSQQSNIQSLKKQLQYLKQRMDEYGQFQQALTLEITNNACMKKALCHYLWVERNLKRIKLSEYDDTIDKLNLLLAEELATLWGTDLRAQFVTSKEKARGGIKAELDLVVQSSDVDEVPIAMHSGGERKTIVIAVFRAMRRLIREKGLGVNLSAIDEIDKDLDDVKVDKLVDVLKSITNDSRTCIIISHNSRLLNTMEFDHVWTVHKNEGFSSIDLVN